MLSIRSNPPGPTKVQGPPSRLPEGARVLRDVVQDRLQASLVADVDRRRLVKVPELDHRRKSRAAAREAEFLLELEAEAELFGRRMMGEEVIDDGHLTWPSREENGAKAVWKRPGHRQEVVTKRFKRFGIKN